MILPSEKAFAYKMKLEALKKQGERTDLTSDQVGPKLSVTEITDDDSPTQVKRYIRLTNLIPELLELVDSGKIAFNPAVELSFLSEDKQRVLLDAMDMNDCTPSHSQAIRLKKHFQEGFLDDESIYDILAEQKPNQQENFKFKRDDIRKYFPPSYTDAQVYEKMLEILKAHWEKEQTKKKNRDAR